MEQYATIWSTQKQGLGPRQPCGVTDAIPAHNSCVSDPCWAHILLSVIHLSHHRFITYAWLTASTDSYTVALGEEPLIHAKCTSLVSSRNRVPSRIYWLNSNSFWLSKIMLMKCLLTRVLASGRCWGSVSDEDDDDIRTWTSFFSQAA